MNALPKERIDSLFAKWSCPESPGCALGIYHLGEPIYLCGYGAADLEQGVANHSSTMFHIASLSKQFTAAAILLLARDGKLSLDESIRKYIPELPEVLDVTLNHIIHHTSGLRDQWDLLRLAGWRHADLKTTEDIVRLAIRQQSVNFPAGARFQYINTGYTLMGVAIQRITGKSLRQFTTEQIFEPLGMRRTWFHDDHTELVPKRAAAYSADTAGAMKINMPAYETVGPTSLLSTVEDFARWDRNFLEPRVGDAEFVRQLTTPPKGSSYAAGLISGEYGGLPTLEHAGGDAGYRAHYLRFPSEKLGIAIFCNSSEIRPGEFAREVADICREGRVLAVSGNPAAIPAWAGRAAGVSPVSPGDLETWTGHYRDSMSGMTCRIELHGARLVLVGTGEMEYELLPAGPGRFQFSGIDAECSFEEGSNRMVVKYAGQQAALCEPVEEEAAAPVAGPPEDYAGAYWSEELELFYHVQLGENTLVFRRPRFAPENLNRLSGDEFCTSRDGFHIRFVRDADGRVDSMLLTAERVWNARFSRQALA